MFSLMNRYNIWILLLLTSCDTQPVPKNVPKGIVVPNPTVNTPLKSPNNPLEILPLPIDSPQALDYFEDVIHHPWVKRQTEVKVINREMVEDIEKYKSAYKLAKDHAMQSGQRIPSYEELNDILIREYEHLEKEIAKLDLKLPTNKYQVVMLPENTYKRFYIDDTALGIPFYLDVKVHSLFGEGDIEKIKKWYWNLLKGGRESFKPMGVGFIGHGDRNIEHFDPSHGFAVRDRGIYVSFYRLGNKMFVLYADAPWIDFEKHGDLWKGMESNRI